MSETNRLALPRIDAAQAQKHVTHNEALALIDALVHLSVIARNAVAPPVSPAEGERYLVGAAPTGAFAGHAGALAVFDDGAWRFLAPRKGWRTYVEAEGRFLLFDGIAWISLPVAISEVQNLRLAGIGTTADAGNPLSARLNAALFTALPTSEAGTGDLRFKLNKQQASATVSQLYQSNYSGRAEAGLIGDDRFRIKVSPDGATWKEALSVEPATGRVFFPNGASDLAAAAAVTSGTPAAYVLSAPLRGPLPEGALFWLVPHAPNATALDTDPTLQLDGIDATPLPLKNFDGTILPQGALEAGKALAVRKTGQAYYAQTARVPYGWLNLLEDGGRFAGVLEPVTPTVSAFADVGYFVNQNGTTRTNFGVARANSLSFGGTAAAMPAPIADLVGKIRSGAALLGGSEFFVMQVNVGAGTSGGVSVQGTSFYQPLTTTRATGKAQTSAFYFRVMSGSAVIAPSDACPRVLVDGLIHNHLADAPERVFTPAHGWKHMQRWLLSPGGGSTSCWPLRATPGSVFLIALPAVVQGLETLPWDIGPVPSLRVWR